jgi:hypothetical protein
VVNVAIYLTKKNFTVNQFIGARGGAVGWGTVLQSGRSRVRFPVVSSEYFIDYGPGVDSASNSNEYQEYFLGVKAVGV